MPLHALLSAHLPAGLPGAVWQRAVGGVALALCGLAWAAEPPSGNADLGASATHTAVTVDAHRRTKPTTPTKPSKNPAPVLHDRHDSQADLVTYGHRADAMRLATEIAQTHGLDPAWVASALAGARFVPEVTRLIMPGPVGVAKNWASYRARFVEPQRIGAGVAFWDANARWLDAAQARFGVPPEVIVGIVGVETFYGRIMGRFRVLDALATLSLDFPTGRSDRSAFFRDELAQLLLLASREGVAPGSLLGSFAGAIGLGQFMPGSINRVALDFDGDGHIDMTGSPADVIGSIAHYLADAGWVAGMPTHFALDATPAQGSAGRAALLVNDITPGFTPAQMAEQGATLSDAGQRFDGALAFVELRNGDAAPSAVAGTANFYAVTRYNRSAYYALGVIELGQAVAAQRLLLARR